MVESNMSIKGRQCLVQKLLKEKATMSCWCRKNRMIDVNNIIWECEPRIGWTWERITINAKGITTFKVQWENMGHSVESGMDVPMVIVWWVLTPTYLYFFIMVFVFLFTEMMDLSKNGLVVRISQSFLSNTLSY